MFESMDRIFVESGKAKFFAATCARVQMHILGYAAFLAADFAYQSSVLLLRIVAVLFAPVAFSDTQSCMQRT